MCGRKESWRKRNEASGKEMSSKEGKMKRKRSKWKGKKARRKEKERPVSRNESNPVKRRKGKEDVTGGKRKGEDTWREVKRRTRHEWLTTGCTGFFNKFENYPHAF